LHELGVLTAVLTNEGMLTDEALEYQSGRYHRGGHVDLFLCWNEMHKRGVLEAGTYPEARVEVVGVPRFDFYFEPWSAVVREPRTAPRERPQVLICTNTGLAKFKDMPRRLADRHFAQWGNHLCNPSDHWTLIDAHWQARARFLQFAEALAEAGRHDIVFRPHPSEPVEFYTKWHQALPPAQRARIELKSESNISGLILDCDLEISDESCTTALESWIARKPTIGIEFDRNSELFFEERARGHVTCNDPAKIADLVDEQLKNSDQMQLRAIRDAHLAKWCSSPDGKSTERIAQVCADAVLAKKPTDWSRLAFNDYRRSAKLLGYGAIGLPYHFDPLLGMKRFFFGQRYAMKQFAYYKSIRPSDVRSARERLEGALSGRTPQLMDQAQ
jgi:surface carbohydrate biosynthesis protein